MQGLNVNVEFIKYIYGSDDASGGAVVTGTVVYQNVPARISARRPTQQALEAGLEVPRLFDLIVNTQDLSEIFERDICRVCGPSNHPYVDEQMRIISIQHDSRLPGAGHTEMTLSRIEKSRVRQ